MSCQWWVISVIKNSKAGIILWFTYENKWNLITSENRQYQSSYNKATSELPLSRKGRAGSLFYLLKINYIYGFSWKITPQLPDSYLIRLKTTVKPDNGLSIFIYHNLFICSHYKIPINTMFSIDALILVRKLTPHEFRKTLLEYPFSFHIFTHYEDNKRSWFDDWN